MVAQMGLSAPARLCVLPCRVQFIAKHLSSPFRDGLCGFAKFAAGEVSDHAACPVMDGVVVEDQLVGMLADFSKILRCLSIRVHDACPCLGFSTSAHTH